MKILQINSVYGYGSTGRIVESIHKACISKDIDSYVIFSRLGAINSTKKEVEETDNIIRVYNDKEFKEHVLKAVLLDKHGLYSNKSTYVIIDKIKEINPDIIHLHNIHGFYLNYEILFEFLKKFNKKIIWTLHDCWAFTGYCSHYEYNECNEWKTGCLNCKYSNVYPYRLLSNSKDNYIRKSKVFNSVDDITIITPSFWLKQQIRNSFLKGKVCKVITNGLSSEKFKFTKTNILEKYGIFNKKIILAVSSIWTKQKGFDEYLKLAKLINEDWKIVMVGLSKKQIKKLPKNIIGIERTNSIEDLIELYSAATVFVNLTLEETFSLVNIEAQSCSLPVITYNTGGSPETVLNKENIVDKYDLNKVIELLNNRSFNKKRYNIKNTMIQNYIELYYEVING
ncbi:MAG: glycosyltransferase [Erysipelotrichaceae bacterium]|nr:glycosyltransferase [Erysipelotrichaceae bacterium]